jgi:hypothetical protein
MEAPIRNYKAALSNGLSAFWIGFGKSTVFPLFLGRLENFREWNIPKSTL